MIQKPLYGLFREGLPTFLPALLSQTQSVQRNALEKAINDNIISARFTNQIDSILQRLRELITEHAFDEPKEKGRTSLGSLLKSAITSTIVDDQKKKVLMEKFLNSYVQHQGPIEDFWKAMRQDQDLKGEVENLQLTLQLGALSWNHLPLVNKIQEMRNQGRIKSFKDLAKLDFEDWLNVIRVSGFPPEVQGKDLQEKTNNYAKTIVRIIEDTFPTTVVSERIKKDVNISGKDDLVTFFDKNPDFDFHTTYIEKHVKKHPESLEGVQDTPALKANLKRFQRVFKLTPRYSDMKALLSNNLGSAQAISKISRNVFVKKYGGLLSHSNNTNQAKIVYENALQMSGMAKNLYLGLAPGANDISTQVMYAANEQQKPILDDAIPDWETLFGTFDLCECQHCRSALSPAAYLVDILHFLSGRQSKIIDKTAKDILFQRRPDIGEIELTCENTNTPLPYVDLVNEILEESISPSEL